MLITLEEKDESAIRNWAKKIYGGKKGAICMVIHDLVQNKLEQQEETRLREERIKRFRSLMDNGFKGGLGKRKAYEKRDDIYEGARGR